MNKIKNKIWIVIALIIIVAIVVPNMVEKSIISEVYRTNYENNLSLRGDLSVVEINKEFERVERIAHSIANITSETFDLEKHGNDETYMESYQASMKPVIKNFAKNVDYSKAAFLIFLPEIQKGNQEIYYFDSDQDGETELQKSFTEIIIILKKLKLKNGFTYQQ